MTTVAELVIAADPASWRAAGFEVDSRGMLVCGSVGVLLTGGSGGMTAWKLAGAVDSSIADIDGLSTTHVSPDDVVGVGHLHPNGVFSVDHIVVQTPDLERTCAAIEAATGATLKRIREFGSVRQGFHRLGEVIVEVVSYRTIAAGDAGGAVFWGLALNVADIDAIFVRCGEDLMSPPKDAVQPGRRIASFRESAGLGLPVAVMTPHTRS